jgi:hypothetical protein
MGSFSAAALGFSVGLGRAMKAPMDSPIRSLLTCCAVLCVVSLTHAQTPPGPSAPTTTTPSDPAASAPLAPGAVAPAPEPAPASTEAPYVAPVTSAEAAAPTGSDALEAPPSISGEPEPNPAEAVRPTIHLEPQPDGDMPRKLGPVRKEHRLSLLGEIGWNSLVGFGPELAFHAHPNLTIEGGGGVALEGWKVGVRARYNFLQSRFTPFVGAGGMQTSGISPVDVSDPDDAEEVTVVRVKPSTYGQAVVGIDWISRGRFNLVGCVGYAWLLSKSNVEELSGTLDRDERLAMDVVFGSGMVLSLAMGYNFH